MTSDSLQHRLAVALEGGDHRGWLGRIIAYLLVALILVNIVDIALDTVPDLYQHFHLEFAAVQVGSMAIFTLEFAARLWVAGAPAPDRPETPARARLRHLASLCRRDLVCLLPSGPARRVLELSPASWRRTAEQPDVQRIDRIIQLRRQAARPYRDTAVARVRLERKDQRAETIVGDEVAKFAPLFPAATT